MSEETYNGWTNRETWALNLWLTADHGLYEMTREQVYNARELAISNARHAGFGITGPGTRFHSTQEWMESGLGIAYIARKIGDAVRAFWGELTDPDEGLLPAETIITMLRDIGSEYRVNWGELGSSWLADLGDELTDLGDSE